MFIKLNIILEGMLWLFDKERLGEQIRVDAG